MKKLALTVFFDSFVLILLGLIIVMSASSTYSTVKFDSAFHLFNSHLVRVFVGIILMIGFAIIPYKIYRTYSKTGMFMAVGLLIATLIFAPSVKGAGRWLSLGFITVQAADVAKLALIIHLAALIEQKDVAIMNFKEGYIYLFTWVMITAFLIFLQPNVSNALLIIIISLGILFVGGAKFKHIAGSLGATFLAGFSAAMIFPHSRSRILTFIDSVMHGGDINLQVKQALYGLGSGGILGVGLGNSKQNNLFLPEAYGDFIFAILGEEFGFVGSMLVLLFFLILFVAGILIAKRAKDKFGQLLAFGISFSIIIYAFINVAVATGMLPTTGLPLPFISYGGTSLLFLCISIGILINIAFANTEKESDDPQKEVQPINMKQFGYE